MQSLVQFLFYRGLTSTKLKICSKFGISNLWISLNVFEKSIDRIISLLSKRKLDGKLIFISIQKQVKGMCDILVDINGTSYLNIVM